MQHDPKMSRAEDKQHHEPHHFVFSLLPTAIIRGVKIEAVLHHLVEKKIIPKHHASRYRPKNGMKVLIGHLTNQSFETFLEFVECIFLAQGEKPSKAQSVTVVESIIKALKEYDNRNGTCWVDDVIKIQQRYMKESRVAEKDCGRVPSLECYEEVPTKQDSRPNNSFFVQEGLGGQLLLPGRLHYIGTHQESFNSEGGRFEHFEKCGFSLLVPPLAVPEGKEISVRVGLCCYGPFSISDKYLIASDFAVIVANDKFDRPVEIFMEHCLILPEYKKCSEVVILRADHTKVTEEDSLYTFDQLTNPEILPYVPKLTFNCNVFGILCAALRSDLSSSLTSASSPTSAYPDNCSPGSHNTPFSNDRFLASPISPSSCTSVSDDRLLTSPTSALMGHTPDVGNDDVMSLVPSGFDVQFPRPWSTELQPPVMPASSEVRLVSSILRLGNTALSVRAPRPCQEAGSWTLEKYCGIEYAALLIQPKKDTLNPPEHIYHFALFFCTNCAVAHEVCMEQAQQLLAEARQLTSGTPPLLRLEPDLEVSVVPFVWRSPLRMDYCVEDGCVAWTVEPWRTPTLSLDEVQFHTMNREDRIQQRLYPPPVLFTAECDKGASRRFSCTVKLEGATAMETSEEVFFNIRVSYQMYVQAPASERPCE